MQLGILSGLRAPQLKIACQRRFRRIPQPNHDRVADAIEIVISRRSLAMLRAVPVDEFVLKYQKPL